MNGKAPSKIMHENLGLIGGHFAYRDVRPTQLSLMVVAQLDVMARYD
jgi:hypothetical protein